MNRTVGLSSLLLGLCVYSAAGKTVVEWTFDKPGDLQGWQPNGELKDVVVTNGVLACRAMGRDPILELQPRLDFKTSPRQMVEVRLKADADGEAELFWGNTATGLYGGFTQEKSLRLRVCGDGAWRVYHFLPCWHLEGKIVRLRFDVYDAARFELDYLRIVELDASDSGVGADFDFAKSGQGWQWLATATDREPVAWNGGKLHCASAGLLLSPPLQLDADRQAQATVRMAVNHGTCGTLYFISEAQAGLQSLTFPVVADGAEHTYHLDLLADAKWRGRILALGLRPSDATNVTANLRSFKVGDAAQTPPQLSISFFALEDALPRAGVPSRLLAVVHNSGGRTATNLIARLRLPAGIKLLGGLDLESQTHTGPMNGKETAGTRQRLGLRQPSAAVERELAINSGRGLPQSKTSRVIGRSMESEPKEERFDKLGLGEEARFEWIVQANRPLDGRLHLTLTAANAEKLSQTTPARFTARLSAVDLDHVPEPKPVRGPFEVGVYYFPGWKMASQWQPIQGFPERKPVLGWYREGEPEIADWHIKWAVEHGITFFAYDWYWSQGARQLEHALHDGYFKARYHHLLKFCLLWANHNPPHTSSHEDCLAVTRYWIENYFRRPEHLAFDGKPVVIIFSADRLTADLGSDGVKRAFEAMREECRRAGLKGLYLIACVSEAGVAKTAASEGYDAITAYTWPGVGMTGEGMFAPFETLVPAYRRQWEHLFAESPIPLTPLPVCGGWDSRPWHGENNLVRFGRTPELFKRHLLDAKQVLELRKPKAEIQKAVLVEAWNEWGEGSYIEPHREFGFGYLDAIREVFTDAPKAHDDVTPADVGLGPYDVLPPTPAKTSWEFDSGDDGWSNARQLSELTAGSGLLVARTIGNDPAFVGPSIQARASQFRAVVVRMKLARTDGVSFTDAAQLFWRTSRLPESESSSMRFPVQADGQWHEYRVPVSENPRWRAMITRLWLNPCHQPNVKVDLDFVRLAE